MKRKRRTRTKQQPSFRMILVLTLLLTCMGSTLLFNSMSPPKRTSTGARVPQATVFSSGLQTAPTEVLPQPTSTPTLILNLSSQDVIATQAWFVQQQTQAVAGGGALSVAPISVSNVAARTMYSQGSVNVRSCPQRTCDRVNFLVDGQAVNVTGETQGDAVQSGNATWYRVNYERRDGFVYSAYLTDGTPSPVPPTRAPFVPVATQAYSPQPVQVYYSCNGIDDLNCSDFSKDGVSAQQHLLQCGYDEDRLDGDKDGFACEYSPF